MNNNKISNLITIVLMVTSLLIGFYAASAAMTEKISSISEKIAKEFVPIEQYRCDQVRYEKKQDRFEKKLDNQTTLILRIMQKGHNQ